MTQREFHVLEAVAALDVWPEQEVQVLHRLGDGPTNETWLLMHQQQRYVLRMVKPMAAQLGLSLVDELVITAEAARHNLAAPIVVACASRGLVLSRYRAGRVWTDKDLHDEAQLSRLADTLSNVHRLDCAARPPDLRNLVYDYAQRSGDRQAAGWADNALSLLNSITPRTPVICHGDPTAANIIDDGSLFLIDWEYAGAGDPLFDLAIVAAHHELDEALMTHFLLAYCGETDVDAVNDFARWCDIYRYLHVLWLSALAAGATGEFSPQQAQQLGVLRNQLG